MPNVRRPAKFPPHPGTASIARFTDREILLNIRAAADGDGLATTTAIAIECGFTGNGQKNQTPAVKIATRLAYMRAIGLIESLAPEPSPSNEPGAQDRRWRPTRQGETLMAGKMTKAVSSALDRMQDGDRLLLLREVMRHGYVEGDETLAYVLRRETQHHIAARKLPNAWRR